ncbi:conserved Plasmodium protein, unknown function [Plasmodium malariae]|uniref:Uncharacterized protein n=1 Tax=Plasmodium malariae TaxID=5858 RepID=A0A1C3KZ67_PLAMA|nr:conserved Plasmodium protein, unknown function [Plasmodium malariae]
MLLFFGFLFIGTATNELINNSRTLKGMYNRIIYEAFSPEQVIIIKKKRENAAAFYCPFEKKKKKTTFECVKRYLLKNSKNLFYLWSHNIPKIHPNQILEREKIYTSEFHDEITRRIIKKRLNYVDISSFSTYCSFYKLCVSDLLKFNNRGKAYNTHMGTMRKRYFVKTDHLNSDPLDESSYIFITGEKKEKYAESIPQFYDKFYSSFFYIVYYYYVTFMNNILDHTFFFVFNNYKDDKSGEQHNSNKIVSNNYIIYKNEIIYPFKFFKEETTTMIKNSNTYYDDINDFYLIEICHYFNGITYKQNMYGLFKRLSNLYFNIELVSYLFQLPPVFYHTLIILISSLVFAYIFYKIFLKYKNCF